MVIAHDVGHIDSPIRLAETETERAVKGGNVIAIALFISLKGAHNSRSKYHVNRFSFFQNLEFEKTKFST